MTEIVAGIVVAIYGVASYLWGKHTGYDEGFIAGKHDMLNFINKNTRPQKGDKTMAKNPGVNPRTKPHTFPGTKLPKRVPAGPGKPRP